MDSFEFNKIAGAVLGTALGVMALSIISEAVFSMPEPAKPGFEIAVAETGGGEAGGAAPASDVPPIAVRLQTADATTGEKTSKICTSCHTLGKGEPAKIGPNLYGIVGDPAAHMEGFSYSKAMLQKKADGLTWTFENLDHFLTAPKAFVPGTAMGFAGFKKPEDRANVIAYLRTLSDNPVPLPTPEAAPAAAPAATEAPPPAASGAADAPAQPPAAADSAPGGQTEPPAEATPGEVSPPGQAATPPAQ